MKKRFPTLSQVDAGIISSFAGGNTRVAIALASRVEPDETLANFSDEELFHRLFHQRKETTDNLLESAEILSLVYSFNTSNDVDELTTLSKIGGSTRENLFRHQAELSRRHLVQKRGDWRAVLPHALANRLARRALQNFSFNQINAELFKKNNLRLLSSCAHRLGYLHDFEPARQLASTWMQSGGPLYDITLCDDKLLLTLTHIAPVFPDVVLTAIEKASKNSNFCSRDNKHFMVFVRLLKKIAYDDENFDRAANLILKFAETEEPEEQNNSIVNQFSGLFSLYLSGTHASPERRRAFLKRMLHSGSQRQLEIAKVILRSALGAFHWVSSESFDFGARSRDYGWEPKTDKETLEWYVGFIDLLEPLISSKDESLSSLSKSVLAGDFLQLWQVGCFDALENLVVKHASHGKWSDMWLSIKSTIYHFKDNTVPELLSRLETLEKTSSPVDLFSEIEAYALTNIWSHTDIKQGGNWEKNNEEVRQKIRGLGRLTASDFKCLERLSPRLWKENINALFYFGFGLAKGSQDRRLMFETLVSLVREQDLKEAQSILFEGFVAGVHEDSPSLARQIQESILEMSELKMHVVHILSATPITQWGVKMLIELAEGGELKPCRFTDIIYRGLLANISDDDLSKLLFAINRLEGGIFSTIKILNERFSSEVSLSSSLLPVGKEAIFKLLSMHRDDINKYKNYAIDLFIEKYLAGNYLSEHEIRRIVDLFCEGVEAFRLYTFELSELTCYLAKNYPEYLLDKVFEDNEKSEILIFLLFRDNVSSYQSGTPLNLAPVEKVLNWCAGNQERIQNAARCLSSYELVEEHDSSSSSDCLKQSRLSSHIISLLDVAENKTAIIEIMFDRAFPLSWSGPRSSIIESCSKAFADLLNHNSKEVREAASNKLGILRDFIKKAREEEAELNANREQKFE